MILTKTQHNIGFDFKPTMAYTSRIFINFQGFTMIRYIHPISSVRHLHYENIYINRRKTRVFTRVQRNVTWFSSPLSLFHSLTFSLPQFPKLLSSWVFSLLSFFFFSLSLFFLSFSFSLSLHLCIFLHFLYFLVLFCLNTSFNLDFLNSQVWDKTNTSP